MLDQSTRETILRLRDQGRGTRKIARTLGISRGAVKDVLAGGSAEVPSPPRAEKADPYREQIVELFARCKGNLVRVHEELVAAGATLSYQALTGYCRRRGIGHEPPRPAGQYDFLPGEEMQHDTSPHDVVIGGRKRRAQTASVVLCFSRMIFFQIYPRFTRFECKVFLTEGAKYFEGVCHRAMIDNTHLVVLSGTGRDMVPVPEMVAFGGRLGFVFVAHEKGDANRSARVERPFDYIENNFLAGREFEDWAHVNREARAWCDKVNATPKRHLHASPRELFATERLRLMPLPAHVPEVYQLHERIVDTEGYVNVHRNRYSAPWRLLGRRLEVRELFERIELYDGPRRVAVHSKLHEPTDTKVTLAAHRPPRGEKVFARDAPPVEERALTAVGPEMVAYLELLKKRGGRSLRAMRRLVAMMHDYPREALLSAIRTATHYGLIDMDRFETLVLRHIAGDFFPRPTAEATGDLRDDHEQDDDRGDRAEPEDEDEDEDDEDDEDDERGEPEDEDAAPPEDDDDG